MPPAITTAASATATVGSAFNFTVKATGAPAPTMAESGTLPQGLTWTDNGNGTATLAGTPGVGQGGVYKLTLTATNAGGTATQAFTLTVRPGPVHHQRRDGHGDPRQGLHVHVHQHRLPGAERDPHRDRAGADLHQQRQRDGHPEGDPDHRRHVHA